jgi:glutamate synthase domain-containing protein 2/glutamate synthase domain-containing protein 1/glutamate synthase domain-containing protein 3
MSGYIRIGEQLGAQLPHRGLFDPAVEHDACGVAFVARIAGGPAHSVVEQGMQALVNLGHRGASGAEPDSGDGAGILLQLPDAFLREASGISLPAPGAYGVGMAMLPQDPDEREQCETITWQACRAEGLRLLGWRDVPVIADALGRSARTTLPALRQLFVAAIGLDGAALEGRLLVLRRVIERNALAAGIGRDRFHWGSLSSRTVVYKGMLTAAQLAGFYPDLLDERVTSTLALVHARFSTNVLPRWDLAQPFRMSAHNGEINTLRGNVNWMRARQSRFRSPHFGDDIAKLIPVLDESGSDSSQFDNALELLAMSGRPIVHAVMMMIPEAWHQNPLMDVERRAFYEFHSSLLEPWDGPAAIAFTDGRVIGATLDRNGLRPARYLVTEDGLVVMASEAGVLDLPEEQIARKWRLEPGRLLLVDTAAGRILDDAAVKSGLSAAQPYSEWIREGTVHLDELDPPAHVPPPDPGTLLVRQQAFGYSVEDVEMLLEPMGETGEEAVGSMGNDTPLAVLSDRPLPLFNYFKQLFAQVTNPPIDPIREQAVMSLVTTLGAGGNLLEQGPSQAKRLEMPHPVLTNHDLEKLRHVTQRQFPAETISMVFHRDAGAAGLVAGIERICRLASKQIEAGATVLILSDRHIDASHVPIPSLLATAAVHQHLVREQTRTGVGLVVETGEAREVMHIALLIGYGAEAVNPYLAFETIADISRRDLLPPTVDGARAEELYVQALVKGLRKTIARMGISTIQSYCSAQIFECLGIDRTVIDRYFPNTPSRIGGIGMDVIAAEAIARHQRAFPDVRIVPPTLEDRGEYRWRRDGEHHQWNPEVIGALQHAVKSNDETAFRTYVALADDESRQLKSLRGLFVLQEARDPVPLEEVEPVMDIVRRFSTGGMSHGSLSKEAHELLAIAMNRIGARSNTGEGGEDSSRFKPDMNGDWRRSAIKQVASARFGVTAHYLVNADELQIKIAQGAKPGEGGQLPGPKVDEAIARLRHSTPGVGLISPPPHHDIYSIEDLAQLIWDLRCVNPQARISVKLVAEAGVGTVAAGVAKARADHIVIAGYEGGTGASPLTAIKHAGVPWELGLAEAQQVLTRQRLRSRVALLADGQMKTGRDVVVGALLGADEFAFATAPLVAAGCVMMRVCHLNTCPVGIATQDPVLRARFAGRVEHVVAFMLFLAEDVRRWMSRLGFRRFEDMIGRVDLIGTNPAVDHWKARGLDLQALLTVPDVDSPEDRRQSSRQSADLGEMLDNEIIARCGDSLDSGVPVRMRLPVRNVHRSVGAMLSGEIARRHGAAGLPDGTVDVELDGAAGQSFGAWLARGVTLTLRGEANDYVGKGLSGGRLVILPPRAATRRAEDNIVIGNVALYGATSGEAFIRGVAGERFCVRNSGAIAVVEGVGDHGCEYMTGGTVIVLGATGRNFAAGMSGGVVYVLDEERTFTERCNSASVTLEPLGVDDHELVRGLLEQHAGLTGSTVAMRLLRGWAQERERFVKVMPEEYRRALRAQLELVS